MNLFTTNVPLQNFNNEVSFHLNSIEEKETKIILALSDLLEEKDNHENFIKNSLNYLEVNYGLSRRVWLVLLKLHDKLPNFTDLLSTWKIEIIKNMEFNYWLNNRIPLGDLPFYLDHRKHSIQKLFFFIDSLAPHFKTDEICDLLSLFLVEFDTGKSPFSLKKLLKTNVPEAYKLQSLNYIFVSYSYSVHSSLKNLLDVFKPKDRSVYVRSLANRLYKVGISSLYPEETLENIKVVFAKYTSHPFLSYSGFVEIKEKEIDECDFDLISCLLESFEKSFLHSKFYHMFFINILKLLSSYGDNVENGIDKVLEIYDYGYMADDYILKAIEKPDYKLKDLLAWSNAWHMNGEHININVGEKVFFKDFNVGHSIEEYDFVQILNNHSLHAEGKTQKHCVFNYERKCIENDTIIVSMRNKKNNIVSTLRFQILKSGGFFKKSKFSVKLVENRKKFNAKCNEYETSIVNEYVKFVYKNIQLTL